MPIVQATSYAIQGHKYTRYNSHILLTSYLENMGLTRSPSDHDGFIVKTYTAEFSMTLIIYDFIILMYNHDIFIALKIGTEKAFQVDLARRVSPLFPQTSDYTET
jgi:hypothetical protein